MPLHLLGKKSWNVYNQDNIERVRHDEAEAQNREEEEDRRTQIVDSERRLKLLRGEAIDDLPLTSQPPSATAQSGDHGRSRKRRRLAGEDGTDPDLRLARSEVTTHSRGSDATLETADVSLIDSKGHINLFPPGAKAREPNPEAEADRAKKKRDCEDQYTMRFSNAAGFKQSLDAPWYSAQSKPEANTVVGKDVWGNEDLGRRERESMRIVASDPLAAMKRGVKQLREVESGRKNWVAELERELEELKSLQRARRIDRKRRKGPHDREDGDVTEDFSLDSSAKGMERHSHHRQHRHHRSHRSHHHRKDERSRGNHRNEQEGGLIIANRSGA